MREMLEHVLNPSSYHFNAYSLPVFLTAFLIVMLGSRVFFRKRESSVQAAFFILCLTLSAWLAGMGMMFLSVDARLARFWMTVSFLGIDFIAIHFFLFVAGFLNKLKELKIVILAGYAFFALCYPAFVFSPYFISGFKRYFWGWYPVYGPLSFPFLIVWAGFLLTAVFMLSGALKKKTGFIEHQRIKYALWAFIIALAGSVDYLAAYNFNIYPFGYIPVLCFVAIIVYAMKRYSFLLLTPALAADTIINTMANALIVFGGDGIITAVNPAARELFNYGPGGLTGKAARDIFVEQTLFDKQTNDLLAPGAKVCDFEMTALTSSGARIPVSLSLGAVKDEGVSGYVAIATDIRVTKRFIEELRMKTQEKEKELAERIKAETALQTAYEELKTTQARLLQSEKMAAVGRLVSGVAHELNNPLGVILGFAQSLIPRIKKDDYFSMPILSIEREAIRCKKLVQELLMFSRFNRVEKETSDINTVIRGALTLVEAQARMSSVELISELGSDIKPVELNRHQIQQVLFNLCNNALDAMNAEGTLTVRSMMTPSGGVEVQVSDTGPGIPEEIREKIFEPFFTTKEVGKGTGLGLSLVYEIIQKHGGKIEFDSVTGKGTTFRFTLPGKPDAKSTENI